MRSIPAYAGDPCCPFLRFRPLPVYPRLRGGSRQRCQGCAGLSGLSPPTRGILPNPPLRRPQSRSIPAYAGDPKEANRLERQLEVYPRLRGGSRNRAYHHTAARGLSPPTRGIRLSRLRLCPPLRSIPAYAGDPVLASNQRLPITVYPRLRGGSCYLVVGELPADGLSPPTRGIL